MEQLNDKQCQLFSFAYHRNNMIENICFRLWMNNLSICSMMVKCTGFHFTNFSQHCNSIERWPSFLQVNEHNLSICQFFHKIAMILSTGFHGEDYASTALKCYQALVFKFTAQSYCSSMIKSIMFYLANFLKHCFRSFRHCLAFYESVLLQRNC